MNETQTQPSVFSVALKYGLLTGLLFVVYSLINYLTGNFGNFIINMVITIAIAVLGLVLAMREYKKNNFGYMTYGQGMGIGVITMVVASLISGAFSYIYLEYIDPSVTEKIIDASIEQMANFGVDESMLDEQRDKLAADMTPGSQFINALTGGLVSGILLSLIVSAIMKHKRPEFE